jgi:REase_MTES_1575
LGIECDGATYHSSQSARDRDRLRQEVLERLGWTIERVWSTAWFLDPEREVARLNNKIEAVRKQRRAHDERARAPQYQRAIEALQAGIATEGDGLSLRLNEADARTQLLKLRTEMEGRRVVDPNSILTSVLTRPLIDELLAKRPVSEDEFFSSIRPELREHLDLVEFSQYGPEIFDILARIE